MKNDKEILPAIGVESLIVTVRWQKVVLDSHLARLYGVQTKILNKAVRRNPDRFPSDFMFRLSAEDYQSLRFQFGTLKRGHHSKYLPLAFSEHILPSGQKVSVSCIKRDGKYYVHPDFTVHIMKIPHTQVQRIK